MTKHAHPHALTPIQKSVNSGMKMSTKARAAMRRRERDIYNYYDDMGPGKGNCTWGPGILAHKHPCTAQELRLPVSAAAVEAEFARRVTAAEAGIIRHVRNQQLTQDQFDALVSLTYNAGVGGASHTFGMIDRGDLAGAARNIRAMTLTHVNGKRVVARGLIARRAEESSPFSESANAAAVAKK
jgi:GH24 family phage-related lysozyme (muramidase)